MGRQIKVILVGAGNRANVYGRVARTDPALMQVVGIVDPDPVRRELMREKYGVEPHRCYADVAELVAVEKFADAVMYNRNGCICSLSLLSGTELPKPLEFPK